MTKVEIILEPNGMLLIDKKVVDLTQPTKKEIQIEVHPDLESVATLTQISLKNCGEVC